MAEEEVTPTVPEEPLPDLLRGHTICLITTDAEGRLNIKVDLPEGARINLVGDIVAFALLSGKLMRFLGTIQETTSFELLRRRGLVQEKEDL